MFKKKPNIKPSAPLRSSDRRKIANQLIQDFNLTSDGGSAEVTALRNRLLPENCLSAKFTTTAGPDLATVAGTVYVGVHPEDGGGKGEQRPLWVRAGDEEMFPTVYTLWKNPTLLPLLHTHSPVFEKLQTGADLMIPGLIGPPFPAGAKKGKLVGIATSESPTVAVAVGVCDVDVCGLSKVDGERGRAVRIVHWVGDEIFNYGGYPGFVPESVEMPVAAGDVDVEEAAEELGGVSLEGYDGEEKEKEKGKGKTEEGGEGIRELSTGEIDGAFRSATLYGLHQYFETGEFTNVELPISSSQFISTLVLPFLPPASHFPPHNLLQTSVHPSLNIKKTSHKNAAKFFKQLEKDQLIKTKTRNGGEVVVMDINWDHPEAKTFKPYKLPEAPKEDKKGPDAASVARNEGLIKVVELYRPNGKAINIFSAVGAGTKDYYTPAEVKAIVTKYLEQESLTNPQNKRLVRLDPTLSAALLDDRNAADAEPLRTGQIKRDTLGEKLIKACLPYYIVHKPGTADTDAKPKAGAAPKIQILLEKRQGKKTVTRVSGVEPFGIDPRVMAEELQKTCAGSASVALLHGCSPRNPVMEVTVQGPQKKAVEEYLGRRGVGARFIGVKDTTGGKK
ncbi:uncharacterized protein H6S33_010246 [Morchella sextelata]|uniref:uncharacterized protein n=1 Tax=Morchella sextelata TaxID=1174677 RepID=UPI001D03EF88|nr:uncharacterized protein H6S33_010246 [Morchella sextelata]KAH0612194.1 hypothetical protein H6S33_010246 [Morchella sextelata]